MPETSPAESASDFPHLRTAVYLGIALLTGLALVLGMVWRDHSRRTSLETVIETTAVGDANYLQVTEWPIPEPRRPVASFRGQPLFPVGDKRYEKKDLEMLRLGRDEATGLTIYQPPAPRKDKGEKEPAATYYLKLGPGDFLKVRPASSAK